MANLPDEAELREQQLPPEASWVTAVERAGRIFGFVSSPLLNATNLAKLADEIQARAKQSIDACRRLVTDLGTHLTDLGEVKEKAARYQTAHAVLELLEAVRDVKPASVVESLAKLTPTTSEAAMGSSFASAGDVVGALAATQWKLFDSIRKIQDDCVTAAQAIVGRLTDALRSDEHVTALGPVLRIEQSKAIDLLTPAPMPPRPAATGGVTGPDGGARLTPPTAKAGKKVVESESRENLTLAEAEAEIARLRNKCSGTQVARVSVSWVIEE